MNVCLNNSMKYFDEKIMEAHFSQLQKSYNFHFLANLWTTWGIVFPSSFFTSFFSLTSRNDKIETTQSHLHISFDFDYIQETVSLSWHNDKNKGKQLVWLHWEVTKSTDQPLQSLIVNIYILLLQYVQRPRISRHRKVELLVLFPIVVLSYANRLLAEASYLAHRYTIKQCSYPTLGKKWTECIISYNWTFPSNVKLRPPMLWTTGLLSLFSE